MKQIFNNININFRVQKNANNDNFVLLLHGWGGNLNSFRGLEEFLIENNYSVINLDFPGFGASDLPLENFKLDDYVKIVIEMLEFLNIKKIHIVSHSFGGRVAIKLASSTNFVDRLVLIDSAGIKPKFSFKRFFKQKKYKFLKWTNKKGITKKDLSNYGSDDYKALPQQMKPVFCNVVNEDLTPILSKIDADTLIIWGKKDDVTPYYMAKKLNKKIKNSGLVTFENAGHFSYLTNHSKFLLIIKSFLS